VASFDVDELIKDCIAAASETEPRLATRDVLARVVDNAPDVTRALAPSEGGLGLLYDTPDLTIINIVWAPGMTLLPHDHRMWAAIAIYSGREENQFFRRDPDDRTRIVETNDRTLDPGQVVLLGDDAIHSVHNPLDRLTGAIHVYGGDFVREPRSQWGPGEQVEQPYDLDFVMQTFADANARAANANS
jgi:predicted metal-dependent enzyme (double-stranded beta helix superfamily)